MKNSSLILFTVIFSLFSSVRAQVDKSIPESEIIASEKLDCDRPVFIWAGEDGLFYILDDKGDKITTFAYQLAINIKIEEANLCVKLEWVFMNGKKESLWKKKGLKYYEETYHDGLLHGVRRAVSRYNNFFENGTGYYTDYYNGDKQVFVKGELINGKRKGIWKVYFRSGQVRQIENYKDGMLEGKKTTFFESGQVQFEEHYKNNLLHGKYTSYDKEGNVLYTTVFANGTGWFKSYDVETKKIKEDGRYRNGYRVGAWVETRYCMPDGEKQERRVRKVKKYTKDSPENRHMTHKLIETVYDDGNIYHVYASNSASQENHMRAQ